MTGLVPYIAYMIDPIVEAYEVILMRPSHLMSLDTWISRALSHVTSECFLSWTTPC